ncbi:hypothetical protein ANCCAN_28612, partial [Ancylostoma caninum]
MFPQLVVILAICFSCATAQFPQVQTFPAQGGGFMPGAGRGFMNGFTEQDRATMRQFFQNFHTYGNDEGAKAALRAMSPQLATRFE